MAGYLTEEKARRALQPCAGRLCHQDHDPCPCYGCQRLNRAELIARELPRCGGRMMPGGDSDGL